MARIPGSPAPSRCPWQSRTTIPAARDNGSTRGSVRLSNIDGTRTGGRVNSPGLDASNACDPFGGAHAFSLIGFSSTHFGAGRFAGVPFI
jgi:hypothetical protein